jgi:hypothetical protein
MESYAKLASKVAAEVGCDALLSHSVGAQRRDRHAAPVAELKRNDPGFARSHTRRYLEYLDRHGSLVPRLCDSGVRPSVVFGRARR